MDKGTPAMRVPPNDINAEEATLGSMIIDGDGLMIGVENLSSDDFYKPNNKVIFDAMCSLYNAGTPVDIITLNNKLTELQVIDKIGGIEYLGMLSTTVSTATSIRHYIDIIKTTSIRRKLIKVTGEVQELSYQGNENIDYIIDVAEKSIFNLLENRDSNDFSPISEVLVTAIDKIQDLSKNKGGVTGLPTGFIDIDNQTAGFQRSDLILIAARPSMGKTAFALNIAQYIGVRKRMSVAIFSLEMSKEQLINRMICSEALINAQNLRTGNLTSDEWQKLVESIEPIANSKIYIDDTPGISATELRAKCRKLKLEKGLDAVFIDYLQLMVSGKRSESRQQEVSDISRTLKAIAREIDAPVIALSQLSRGVEQRHDKRPMLSDLRESGAIEQDADVVAFLYRDEYYNSDSEEKNVAEVIVAKQRNGPTGTIKLRWFGEYTKFRSLET